MRATWVVIGCVLTATLAVDAEVVLTRSGKLYEGQVSASEHALVIATDKGPVVLPRSDEAFRFDTRDEAYRKLAESARSVEKRLELAEWCLKHELQSRAVEQCDQALKLSPGHPEATKLLAKAHQVGEAPATYAESFKRPPPVRPHGLPAETVKTYHSRVLPLLRNSCATAGCHNHTSPTPLAIRRQTYRSDRSATLDSILKQIDPLAPASSPLIRYAVTPHGGRDRAPLFGPYSPRQVEQLTHWANAVAVQANLPSAPASGPTIAP